MNVNHLVLNYYYLMNSPLLNFILLARTAKDSTSFDPSMLYLILALVGIFLLVLLLVFTRARLYPLLKLGYIRILYGRFSYEFLEFFKENNLRNPHNNCIKDEISMHFFTFYKPKKSALFFQTETKIEFGDIPFLTFYKKLTKIKGEPECINVSRFNTTRVKLVGYNEELQNMKMKSFFYFMEEQFVMGEYHFIDINKIKTADILAPLAVKYLKGESVQTDNFYITDPLGDKINYENNGFSITVRYFFRGDNNINQILDSVFGNVNDNGETLIRTMKHEELLNRF
ncbi:MAG: hypothetical protein NTY96_01765 [Bacteroidetes bacterium]|nr:hypothetical protein [Bacteroidota bacterium]